MLGDIRRMSIEFLIKLFGYEHNIVLALPKNLKNLLTSIQHSRGVGMSLSRHPHPAFNALRMNTISIQ